VAIPVVENSRGLKTTSLVWRRIQAKVDMDKQIDFCVAVKLKSDKWQE